LEKERLVEAMKAEQKKLKLHKKLFKEEVLRLRKQLNEAELKS
jgi:hypothetical protein